MHKLQETFNDELTAYINGGVLSRLDLYFSVFVPALLFARNGDTLVQKFKLLSSEILAGDTTTLHIRIAPYKGDNVHVHRMISFLSKQLKEALIGAYVHGSLATCEEVAYSDFDALVILKDEVFESPKRLVRTAHSLSRARTIMLACDPLQHHGWFVLTEADLKFYCNAYFPVELFKYAKSLFDDEGLELEISLGESGFEALKAFEKMADAVIRKIENRHYPRNMYQLKGLLSQFMLLPALYVQARDGRGVFKRESFALARNDFDPANWEIMDEVSEIRLGWNYEISPLQKRLMCHPHVLSRYFAKNFAPAIPQKISRILTAKFYSRMEKLAFLMKQVLT